MDSKLYLHNIISPIVRVPEKLVIADSVDERGVFLQITVDQSDVGLLVGKMGQMANALRTIMRAYGMQHNERISIRVSGENDIERYSQKEHYGTDLKII